MTLADTIIPWTLDWLMHYEFWLATGKWRGGGVEHGDQHQKVLGHDSSPSPPRSPASAGG